MVKLSSCLQLATSKILSSTLSALTATTGQAQSTGARTHITCNSTTAKSERSQAGIATPGTRCARCAWLQWIETSAIAHGDRM